MKKLLFKNWLVLMSLVMACGFTACDDDDNNVGTTPVFPEKQEINLTAGDSQEFSFEANTNWSLSSSAIWCVFVKDEVESFVLSGTAGKQTVTLKLTGDAPAHETSVAKLELTMGGEKVVIGEVRREAMGYDLQLFDEEGNPITELEVGYIDFKHFKVRANYRFAVTNKPNWVKLEGEALVGNPNQEVTGGLGFIQDGDTEKYPITAEQKYTLTFASEDGKSEKQIPVVFNGMPADDIDIVNGPTTNRYTWTISENGHTFTNGAGVAGGGGTSYNKHVSFKLKAKEDNFKIVMIDECTVNKEVQREVMDDKYGWFHYTVYDKCNINFTADELPDKNKRTVYALALPTAKYEEIKNDILGNVFNAEGELQLTYDRYLLMLATQDIDKEQTGADFTVSVMDMMSGQTTAIPVTETDAGKYKADKAYTMAQGTYAMYSIDPHMGVFENRDYSVTTQLEKGDSFEEFYMETAMDYFNPNGFIIYMPEEAPQNNIVITMTSSDKNTKKVLVITPNK